MRRGWRHLKFFSACLTRTHYFWSELASVYCLLMHKEGNEWSSQLSGGTLPPLEVFQPWALQGPPAQALIWIVRLVVLDRLQFANFCDKRVHQLLGCTYFTHFAICPGALGIFYIKCNAVSEAFSDFLSEEYIGSVFELSEVGFRLAPSQGGLLVQILRSLHIHFWCMALFFFDLIEAVLRASATSTLGSCTPKIHVGLTNCVGVKPLSSM